MVAQPSAADHSKMPSVVAGSAAEANAFARSDFRTTERSSPALENPHTCGAGRAIVVFVTAPHASQFECSRSSSSSTRSEDRPRPPRRVAAVTRYRSPEVSRKCLSPFTRDTCANSDARSGTPSAIETAPSQVSSAMVKFCAEPITSPARSM